jgi:hypothetical protein
VNEINPDQEYEVVDSEDRKAELAAAETGQPSPEPPKLSKSEIGKLRKQYVTNTVPRVIACKHRLDLTRHPRHINCDFCIWAWFQNNSGTVQTADELYKAGNSKMIIELNGIKFYKMFTKFMATVESMKKQELVKTAGE